MEEQDIEGSLSILIEMGLYETIKTILEDPTQNREQAIRDAIDSFEAGLPKFCSQIPDVHNFIIRKLMKLEKQEIRLQQMRREQKRNKRIQEIEKDYR